MNPLPRVGPVSAMSSLKTPAPLRTVLRVLYSFLRTKHLCILIHIRIKGEVGNIKMFMPSSIFLLTVPRWCFFCGSFLLIVFCVCLCYTVLSVPCSLVITCWERADLLTLLCVMFSCVFVTFPCGILGQVWYFIVLIPDLCLLPYFHYKLASPLNITPLF